MTEIQILLLVGSGLLGGFVAGLIGVGGGIVFAPVLFFYFQSIGLPIEIVTQLTIGTSLLCTLAASTASSWFQYKQKSIDWSTAIKVGIASAIAVLLMTRLVTTQPWYDGRVFKVVFAVLLMSVAARAARKAFTQNSTAVEPEERPRLDWSRLGFAGAAAGIVSPAAGVGGGIVLVPAYSQLLRLPIKRAIGTSSATIVFITAVGVVANCIVGMGVAGRPPSAIGYVDFLHAGLLSVPAIFTARLGVWTSHRVETKTLQFGFAIIASIVALRLIWTSLY